LGCPKNQVDSDKLAGLLESDGLRAAGRPEQADLVVVNTCAFIEAAREESVETVLALAGAKKEGAKVVVTGCMAERYGAELAEALPEVDQVAGFGAPVQWAGSGATSGRQLPSFDLLNLPRPPARAPWAYLKVAEGCDRRCGFCAIPSFRGLQRSRPLEAVLAEAELLGAQEIVLVAQDLVSWGRDVSVVKGGGRTGDRTGLVTLMKRVGALVERVRLLYLYPSGLTDELIDAVGSSGCPYFDLSLQHVSRPLLQKMRRYGDGDRFLDKICAIRRRFPEAAFRSSFIVGYPGETEEDHDALLAFLDQAQLDWVGFFPFSNEQGTFAAALPGHVPSSLVAERIAECSERQDAITWSRRTALIGEKCRVLVDAPGVARSHREAPEIDGIVKVPSGLVPGSWTDVVITAAMGTDLLAEPLVPA
jgi:ribosomal protein S12 methylthiotransferase